MSPIQRVLVLTIVCAALAIPVTAINGPAWTIATITTALLLAGCVAWALGRDDYSQGPRAYSA